jgi:N-acyl-D-amino-acid deacylase
VHDIVLKSGLVYDGLGAEAVPADVAIGGGRVVAVGRGLGDARRVIQIEGLAVAPGFIDPHAHSDMIPLMAEPQPFKLLQGVTTEIVGNCGYSFAPLSEESAQEATKAFGDLAAENEIRPGTFADYLARIEAAGPTNHIAALVGHNTLRLTANGVEQKLRDGALDEMCALADEAFAAGAAGLSTGLIYVPGAYSDTEEVVALARVARRWGRPYTTHMRDEERELASALDEAIEIGRRAGVRVQVSHCKAAGRAMHGNGSMLLEKLHRARVDGVDIRGDQYPYLAGGTFLAALFPPEAQEGGIDALRARLRDATERARLRALAEDQTRSMGTGLWREVGPADVLVIRHTDPANIGRTLEAIASDGDAWEVLCAKVAEDPTAMMVVTLMVEDDVRTIMADPLISVGSDNGMPYGLDHPRTWGCFPRFLGRYVRELGLIGWPEGIRKMTSSTAAQFGLTGRGFIGPGAVADVCVFDPGAIGHDGTYTQPDVKPDGVAHVLLEGIVVVDDGEFTGERHGRVLRSTGA